MDVRHGASVRYSILDPTGNITALVETAVEPNLQPAVAARIMACHPEVEQVGFVRYTLPGQGMDGSCGELRMAGGEFCGNATMCAAALYLMRVSDGGADVTSALGACEAPVSVSLRVSGASDPVEVRLAPEGPLSYATSIQMPPPLDIDRVVLAFSGTRASLPVVHMEGISHIVVEEGSAFSWLRSDRGSAEQAVRAWCEELGADGLGLMFVSGVGESRQMVPLVFIPGGDTIFWENSCASGSAATGAYLAKSAGTPIDLRLQEPGGVLRAVSDPTSGATRLYGRVSLTGSYAL